MSKNKKKSESSLVNFLRGNVSTPPKTKNKKKSETAKEGSQAEYDESKTSSAQNNHLKKSDANREDGKSSHKELTESDKKIR